jgi:hypothetical protein
MPSLAVTAGRSRSSEREIRALRFPPEEGIAMLVLRAFLVAAVLSAGSLAAQSRTAPSVLEGVWQRVEQIRPDMTRFPAQPGLRIFSGGHYSWLAVLGEGPRPALPDSATATPAQLRAVWGNSFVAETGTFRVQGEQMTQTPIVAKNPAEMAADWYTIFTFRLVGDTLYLAQVQNPTGMLLGTQPTGKYLRVR